MGSCPSGPAAEWIAMLDGESDGLAGDDARGSDPAANGKGNSGISGSCLRRSAVANVQVESVMGECCRNGGMVEMMECDGDGHVDRACVLVRWWSEVVTGESSGECGWLTRGEGNGEDERRCESGGEDER